jgi:hypothetical protein
MFNNVTVNGIDYKADEILSYYPHQKIRAIKALRDVSALPDGYKIGLKEAKDTIEACNSESEYITLFTKYCGPNWEPLTKEEFMNIIEEAIDAGGDKFLAKDMLDSVEFLCSNIRKKGGLDEVAKERWEFMNKI